MSEALVNLNGLTKRFGSVEVLSNINLELKPGRIVGLLGPNGSGKTTLIKVLNGLLMPNSGCVTIAGNAPGKDTKKIVSYLPDKPYFADWMKVKDLFGFFTDFYPDFDSDKAMRLCGLMEIDLNKKMKKLSKGTKEKVQLILVMSRRANLYLLDEPIGGVDPAAREVILKTIISNYSENACVLISTHLISDVEKVLDEAIFIKEGQIVRQGMVDDIRQEEGKTLDTVFREQFAATDILGGMNYVG